MTEYVNAYFDTGFLSPRINFAIFCLTAALAIAGLFFV